MSGNFKSNKDKVDEGEQKYISQRKLKKKFFIAFSLFLLRSQYDKKKLYR